MQDDLASNFPEHDIQILGVNERGHEIANQSITEGRDLPWLQDEDTDQNNLSDVWWDTWQIVYRDVVVVGEDNVRIDAFNLTTHNLAESENYGALRQMLVDAAMADGTADFFAGDANRDYSFDRDDLFQILRAGKYGTGQSATWQEGDWNRDGVFDRLDVIAALQTRNYLQGAYGP